MDHHESSNVDEVNYSSTQQHHEPTTTSSGADDNIQGGQRSLHHDEDSNTSTSESGSSSSTTSSRRSSLEKEDSNERHLDETTLNNSPTRYNDNSSNNTLMDNSITPLFVHDSLTITTIIHNEADNNHDNSNNNTLMDNSITPLFVHDSLTITTNIMDNSITPLFVHDGLTITTNITSLTRTNHQDNDGDTDSDVQQQQPESQVVAQTHVNTESTAETITNDHHQDEELKSEEDGRPVVETEMNIDLVDVSNLTQETITLSDNVVSASSGSEIVVGSQISDVEEQQPAVVPQQEQHGIESTTSHTTDESIASTDNVITSTTTTTTDVAISVEQPTPRVEASASDNNQSQIVTNTNTTNGNTSKITITSYTGPLPPPPNTPPPPMTEEEKRRQQKLMKAINAALADDSGNNNGKTNEQKALPVNIQAMDPFSIEEIDQTQWLVLFNTGSLRNQASRRILMRSSSMRIQQHSNSMVISSGGGSVNTSLNALGSPSEQNLLGSPVQGSSLNESNPKTSPSKENTEHKGLLVKNFFRFLSYGGGYLQKATTKKSSDADIQEVVYFKFPHVRHCLQVFYKPFKILHYESSPYRMSSFKPQFAIICSDTDSNNTRNNVAQSSGSVNEPEEKKKKNKNEKKPEDEENQDNSNDDDILPSMSKILDIEKAQAEKATEVQTSKDPEELFKATEQMGDFTESGLSKKLKNALSRNSNRDSIAATGSSKSSSGSSPATRDKRKSIWNNIFKNAAQTNESTTKKDEKDGKEGSETKKEAPTTDSNDPNFPRQMSFTSLVTNQQNLSEKEIANLQKKSGEKKAVDAFDEIDVSKSLKKSLIEKAKELCAKRPLELLNELTAELQKTESLSFDPQKKLNEVVEMNRKPVQKDTKRLMGVLQPRYEYKPLHTTMCQRFPEIEYPVKKKFRFQLSCSDFLFMDSYEVQNDLFTFSVAIYDAKYSKKVSEDYHFHMFTDEHLMKLPESLHNSLQKRGIARSEKRLFSVSSPNEEMFLVLFVYRVSNGPTKDTIKAHKKKDFNSEFLEKKDKLAYFRYPAFFGFVPLFKLNEKKMELASAMFNFEQMFMVEGDYKNSLNIYSALKQKAKYHSVNASMKAYAELVSDLQKYKLPKPTEEVSSGTSIGDSQLIYKPQDEDSGSINEEHSSYQTPNNYLGDDSTDVANVMEEEDDDVVDEHRSSVIINSGDYGKALFEEQMKILESISINEIPWYKIRYPYMNLQNTLYVYPQGVKLEKTNGKNIVIEVIFRESDSTLPTIEELQKSNPVIINRFTSEKRHSDFSGLEYDTKTPQFLDEIKLDIPAVSNKGNHLLFTFYHIDIDKKSSKLKYEFLDRKEDFGNSERAILGYSFLDLTEKNKVYEADKAQAIYQLKHTDFQRQFFTGELRVYKELQSDYLTKSQTKGILDKISDARFKLMVQLVSTINPRDDILKLFFASIHDLYSPETENKEKILEYICRSILMKFCDIDFSLFMPHLPIVMNILFELMSNISDITVHSTDLRKGAERLIFEQVLVCLRGVYHLTKNHTRGNKFMASYTKYIFDEMNRGYPIYSVLTRVFTDYLEELTKILQEPTKHYFVTNNLTEHDPFRFSWFVFDVIIKSLTLCIKTDSLDCLTIKDSWYLNKSNDGYGWNDEHPLSQEYFVRKVKQLMHHFCSRTKKLLSSNGSGRQNIGLNSNRNLALFIRDLIPFIDREYYIDIVKHYMDCLSGDASAEALLRLKSEFVAILCDYDYFIPLNNLQLQGSNFIVRHFFDVFFATIETNNEKLMLKVGKCLLDLLCKIDFDARYQDTSKRAAIAEIFLCFVDRYMDKEEYLTLFHNDELYILTSFCLLWVLRNLSEQRLTQWWTQAPLHVMINCISFLDYVVMSVHHLDYSSAIPKEKRKGGQRNIRTETVLTVNYLLSKFTEKNVLDQIFENINSNYPIEKLLANKEEYVQVISKLEITRNTKTMTPVKSLLLRSISRLIFNMIFQLTLKDEYKIVTIIFQDCLHPFLTSFNHSLVCSDLYDLTIPKKDRIPYAQKRKVEQKWRWLLGACSLYTEELMGDKAVGDSLQLSKECMSLLLEPFAYVLNFEAEVDLDDEPEDIHVDLKRNTISSGTLKKLIEKFVGMLTLEGETELRGIFHSTFLNTFSSFTTARSLITRLMGVYRGVVKNNTVRLYIEQAMNELLKEAFHALDNEAIALYVHYFEEIALPIRRKQQEDGVKKVHPTLKKIRKTLVQNLLSFKKDESSNPTNSHGQSNTIMIPRGIPIEKLKEPEVSLNQWKIQKSKYISEGMPNPYNIQFNLLSWPATEIARQETIIDLKIFKKIEANEFYNSAWSDIKYKYELAPHISSLTDRVNNISYWVQTTILTESNNEIRKALFKKFVEIAKETYELNNYSAFFAIISGLQSVPVYRLKETRKVLSQDDANIFKVFDDLHDNNRIKLRENLKNTIVNNTTPIIPFIGIFQTDLTFTSDGNPDEFNHPKNSNKKLINYQKRRIYYNTIQTVKDLQSCANLYRLEPIPYLQYVLKEQIFEGLITNDDELHKKSLIIEPRKAQ